MEIPGHKQRYVLLAAFDAYAKTLAAAKKANENAHCSNSDVDEKSTILEHLKSQYEDISQQLTLDGTPLGEAQSREHYQDEDGTDLRVDALDTWMRQTAGAAVPPERIAGWTLDERKLVAAWLRAIELNLGEALAAWSANMPLGESIDLTKRSELNEDARRSGRTSAPSFVDVEWFTVRPDMTADEVTEWVQRGPWKVAAVDPAADAEGSGNPEWELVKYDAEGTLIDRSKTVYAYPGAADFEAATRNRNLSEATEEGQVERVLDNAGVGSHGADDAAAGSGDAEEGDTSGEGESKPDLRLHPGDAEESKPRTRGGRKGGKGRK